MSLFQIELKNGERRGGDMFIRADCLKPVIPWIDQLRNDASEILKFLKFA